MLNVHTHYVYSLRIKSFSLAVEVKSELAVDKDTYNNNNYVPKCPYCAHIAVSCTHKYRLMLVIKLRVYCAQLLFTTVFLFLSAVVSIRARPHRYHGLTGTRFSPYRPIYSYYYRYLCVLLINIACEQHQHSAAAALLDLTQPDPEAGRVDRCV